MADDYFSQFQSVDSGGDDYFSQFSAAPSPTPVNPKKKTGVTAIGSDVISGVAGVLPALGGMVSELPSQLYDLKGLTNYINPVGMIKHQFAGSSNKNDYTPKRAAQIAAAGLAKGGRGIMNIPANTVDYLKQKEVIPNWVSAWRPEELNKRNYREDIGITDQRPGDELIEGTTAFAPNLATGGPISAGFAYGVGQNENPVTTALLAPTAKKIGKVVKATATPIKSVKEAVGFKGADKIRANASQASKQLVDKAAHQDLADFKASGSEKYTSLNTDTMAKGISKAPIKKQLAPDFFELASKEEKAYVRKAFRTQDLSDIHTAYKDLGKYIAAKDRAYKKLTGKEKDALSQAKKIRTNMESALKSAYRKAGGDPFAKRFDEANKYWKENVIDNESSVLLNNYRKGLLLPEDFAKKAARNTTFKAQFGKRYPEIIEYGEQLLEAEKKLAKAKPTTPEARELYKDVNRNALLTQTPKKVANTIAKTTGLGGILNWLTS